MSTAQRVDEILYPESDGQPMGETDVHIDWIIRIRDILKYRYRGQRVYVGSNLLIYYEEGQPHKFVVPDGFVVLDCDPHQRRTFRMWEERRSPNVVFEVTSRSTQREDREQKPHVYEQIGVAEYFVYDPTAEYLLPPLKGFRLEGTDFLPISPGGEGELTSQQLGLTLRLVGGELRFYDAPDGVELLTAAETAEAEVRRLQAELARFRNRRNS